MAKSEQLFNIILSHEGGWSNHSSDRGGKTNMGITLSTWKSCGYDKDGDGDIDSDDLRLITKDDVFTLFKKYYWDKCKADYIHSQSIANYCCPIKHFCDNKIRADSIFRSQPFVVISLLQYKIK